MQYPGNSLNKGTVNILTAFLIIVFVTNNAFSQSNAILELKKNAQDIKTNEIITKPSDPWTPDHLITTNEFAKVLSNPKVAKPIIYYVGFDFLFKEGHIPGSKYAGPASKQYGVDTIKYQIKDLKHNQDIVIYCGCCPWRDCPNIRQEYKIFKEQGFTNVKVLYLPESFAKDWKGKGYAVVK